jgi:hypothetical protein
MFDISHRRYYGSVILLQITYVNHWPWVGTHGWTGRMHINYYYEVTLLADSSYKFETTVYVCVPTCTVLVQVWMSIFCSLGVN